MQILNCLLGGFSNKTIANRLQISEGTVKVHLKGILKKINVQNRTQAAIWALNHGLTEAHRAMQFRYQEPPPVPAAGRSIR
jgi:two-component system nitrate/nitrite response regulator NarL